MRKALFFLVYAALSTTPAYGVFTVLLAANSGPAWMAFAPVVLIYMPCVFYLMSLRCAACRQPVYTGAHLRSVPDGIRKFPLPIFRNCPDCAAALNLGE